MGMGTRKGQGQQEDIWMVSSELARTPGHPFYQRLNELLDGERFGEFVEGLCRKFDAPRYGRPSLAPGIYFRSLLIGYFEGIDSERGIAWRLAASLALRQFVRIGLTEQTPGHSTISRTQRLIDLDTHRAVFDWVLRLLSDRGLIQGNRVGIDATTLEANTGVPGDRSSSLGWKAGVPGDRSSSLGWKAGVPGDRSSSLGWKTEHAVDMDTGAVVAVTLQEADKGDTTTLDLTLSEAGVAVAEL